MKYIVKTVEPTELTAWKQSDRMYQRGRPNWDRIPSATKVIVKEALKLEQGSICCYCERFMQPDDYHIEHIAPQGNRLYKNLVAEYENLLCSCQHILAKGDPSHCGKAKRAQYDPDLFVSTLDITCEDRFKYTLDGQIEPSDVDDEGAAYTIEILKLDLPKLNAIRKGVIEAFTDQDDLTDAEFESFVEGYLIEKEHNQNRYNEFYTTIKQLFGQHKVF